MVGVGVDGDGDVLGVGEFITGSVIVVELVGLEIIVVVVVDDGILAIVLLSVGATTELIVGGGGTIMGSITVIV